MQLRPIRSIRGRKGKTISTPVLGGQSHHHYPQALRCQEGNHITIVHTHSGAWRAITSPLSTSTPVPGRLTYHQYPQALCCLEGSTMSNLVHRRRRCARILTHTILCLEGSTPEDMSVYSCLSPWGYLGFCPLSRIFLGTIVTLMEPPFLSSRIGLTI